MGGGSGTHKFYNLTTTGGGASQTTVSTDGIQVDNTITVGSGHIFAVGTNDITVGDSNVIDSGSVLTFTVSEAIKNGFCEGQAETITEVLELAGISDYKIISQTLSPLDYIIGFLIRPYISGILIMLIIGGIYFELQSPGLGFPSAAAILGAFLYFAPLYLEGLAANWEIAIFFVGVILVAIEIFAIPGFGIAGISGIFLIVTGLTLSMVGTINFEGDFDNMDQLLKALLTVITAIFIAIVVSIKFSQTIFTTTIFGQLSLAKTQKASDGFVSADVKYTEMIGKIGIANIYSFGTGEYEVKPVIELKSYA